MEKCMIAAVAANGAIGRDNALLWRISQDLRHFKALTGHCPLIMGRRTFESMGSRPLPGRRNIVISPTLSKTMSRLVVPGGNAFPGFADIVPNLEEAYAVAETDITERMLGLSVPDAQGQSSEGPCDGGKNAENQEIAGNAAEDRCFIIGGAMVYASAIDDADVLHITHIGQDAPDADSFFPEISPAVWAIHSRSETFTDPKTGVNFHFAEYRRR